MISVMNSKPWLSIRDGQLMFSPSCVSYGSSCARSWNGIVMSMKLGISFVLSKKEHTRWSLMVVSC